MGNMVVSNTFTNKLFTIFNYCFLAILALLCILPSIHILAISFSNNAAAASGVVKLWPVNFNLDSYEYVLNNPAFIRSFFVSVQRVVLGIPLDMVFTILTAYPLSKEIQAFKFRKVYVWFFLVTILFSGGLIPWYMVIKSTGIIDTIWALILPGVVNVFNIILLLNFFRGLPKELEESALMDGASHYVTLWKIFVPLSKPVLATILVFVFVGHWNSWFDGLILMNSNLHYPLQSFLQTVMVNPTLTTLTERDIALLRAINDRTVKSSQIFIAMIPILLIYPFLQKHFTKGLVLGSVKG